MAAPEVRWTDASGHPQASPMIWYGEKLFRAPLDEFASATNVKVCATDAAGKEACAQDERNAW
jgi:hypothetical protein